VKLNISMGMIVTGLVTTVIALAIINRFPALKQFTGQS
jgi:hypothetical protein